MASKNSATKKNNRRHTNRENIKSFAGDSDSFMEKYNTLNQRSVKRSVNTARKENFMSKNSEVPVKDVSKKYGQTIQEKTKKSHDILNKSHNQINMTSPTKASNMTKTKQNRFNTSYQ